MRRISSTASTPRRSAPAAFASSWTTATRPPRSCFPLVLGPLGVEAVSAHGFASMADPGQEGSVPELVEQTRRLVPAVGADLGVVLDRGRAALRRRRDRPGGDERADAAPVPAPPRLRRPSRKARVPGDDHEPRRRDRRRQRARGRPDARLARRPDEGGHGGRRRLRGRRRRRLRVPHVPSAYDAVASLCKLLELLAPLDRPPVRACATFLSRPSSTASWRARGRLRASSCAC